MNEKMEIDLKCEKCGSVGAHRMPLPELHGNGKVNEDKMIICETCPYYQCKNCNKWVTTEQFAGCECKCKSKEFCTYCIDTANRVNCRYCNRWHIITCESENCKNAAMDYFIENRKKCAYDFEACNSYACEHTMIGEESSFVPSKRFYCTYKDASSGRFCAKWICNECVTDAFVITTDGNNYIGCKKHQPPKNPTMFDQ